MNEPVIPFELGRMLLGDQPPAFFFEIVFRTLLIYTYSFVLVRWVGGRSIAQLSLVEFLLVIALGSAVGDPMFYPDVPILHSLAVITVIVGVNKGLDMLIFRSGRAEAIIDGSPLEIARDGVLDWQVLHERRIGQRELFQQLRVAGIRSIGQIDRAFLEANGSVSVFRRERAKAGLPIVPPWEFPDRKVLRAGVETSARQMACCQCGSTVTGKEFRERSDCPRCGHSHFVEAVTQ
ncbi:MAG: DUF421 domain-containing protein [Flavobacteriaceae bacterium]